MVHRPSPDLDIGDLADPSCSRPWAMRSLRASHEMEGICRLAARGPSLQGLGFSGRFERLGGTDDAIPVQSKSTPVLSCPCPVFSPVDPQPGSQHAQRAREPGLPRSLPTSDLSTAYTATVRCLLVTQPSATLGRIRAASTRNPCTDRPPQPRADGRSRRHGRSPCAFAVDHEP